MINRTLGNTGEVIAKKPGEFNPTQYPLVGYSR